MASFGVKAGVVSESDVEGLPGPPTGVQLTLALPVTWTYIWVGLAFLYLLGVYFGMIRISRKG